MTIWTLLILLSNMYGSQPAQRPLMYQALDREGDLSFVYLLPSSHQEPLGEWYYLEIISYDTQSLCSSMYYVRLLN